MPFYRMFSSLVMTPLGVIWYFRMARRDKNYGFILPSKKPKNAEGIMAESVAPDS